VPGSFRIENLGEVIRSRVEGLPTQGKVRTLQEFCRDVESRKHIDELILFDPILSGARAFMAFPPHMSDTFRSSVIRQNSCRILIWNFLDLFKPNRGFAVARRPIIATRR
jgi:hypothetical protein